MTPKAVFQVIHISIENADRLVKPMEIDNGSNGTSKKMCKTFLGLFNSTIVFVIRKPPENICLILPILWAEFDIFYPFFFSKIYKRTQITYLYMSIINNFLIFTSVQLIIPNGRVYFVCYLYSAGMQ